MSTRHTDPTQETRGLQRFLAARGLRTPVSGVFCRRTVTAVQTFLRDNVDPKVSVDGICGPQTERVLEQARGEIQRKRPPARATRIVMHTSSRKKSDFYTFEAEAMRLEAEYKRAFPNDNVRRVLVSSGKQIARVINECDRGSIVSWDVLSHSNAGGIHISADLATPQAADAERQRRHVEYRANSRRPQSAKDALFMEEDMRGMYSSRPTMKLVADYFNQLPTTHAAIVEELLFDRFAKECYVELHGCRTVNDQALEADLFIAHLSARLPCDAVVVGHTRGSFPQGKQGYRHGEVGVYRAGVEQLRTERESLRLPNASTPGQDDRRLGTEAVQRQTRRPTADTGRRDFKNDWPYDPPGHNPPDPPSTCPPHGDDPQYPPDPPNYPPPNPPNPPRGGDPQYPPPNPPNPPGGDDPQYPPPNPPNPPRGGNPQYPPPNPPNPPRGGNPPSRPNPPRRTNPQYPRPNPPNPPRGGDRNPNPNDPQNPRQPRGADVPWGAILSGAAVVGGMVLEHKRQKDRDRRSSNPRVPNNPRGGSSNPRVPNKPRVPSSPRDIGRSLVGGDRKLNSAARGILNFGRR